jgi:hypothetical protein
MNLGTLKQIAWLLVNIFTVGTPKVSMSRLILLGQAHFSMIALFLISADY